MSEATLIDAFPAFLPFWKRVRHESIEAQIDAWASAYMIQWPELLDKQQACYASEGEDWRQVAQEHVFPHLDARLPAMQTAWGNLREICGPTYAKAQERLNFDSTAIFVIYVGIGCGAGWVTDYQDVPAILFGLENMAEEGWIHPTILTGLVAHEIGHLVHFYWLAQNDRPLGSGPWWQLYTEGFAQRCEHVILGVESWHMSANARNGDWLSWCQANKAWLAAEFLRTIETGKSIRPFFGSWYEIRGRKQTGYFLGHEIIRQLESGMTLQEIALLSDVDARMQRELEQIARCESPKA